MKFWFIDMEGEFHNIKLSSKLIMVGIIAYFGMLVFISFFLAGSKIDIDWPKFGISYLGIFIFIIFSSYCRIRKKITNWPVIPLGTFNNDLEVLSSNNLPGENELKDKRSSENFMKKSIEIMENNNKYLFFRIIFALTLVIFTLNTHSFLYFIMMYSEVQINYHLIYMVNIAFPVTICLILLTLIAMNVLYNLWVDEEFVNDFFIKGVFKKIILNIYVIMGCFFLFFGFISCLLSSFCGMVNGNFESIIVFIIFLSLILIPLIGGLLKKFTSNVYKKWFDMKNN